MHSSDSTGLASAFGSPSMGLWSGAVRAALLLAAPFALSTAFVGCGGESVAVHSCEDGEVEDVVCDDGRGQQLRRCEEGRWVGQTCEPLTGVCADGVEQRTACDGGGSKVELCKDQAWALERACGAACSPGTNELEACGFNTKGERESTCGEDGQWHSGDCANLDACENESTQEAVCQQYGLQDQVCEDGEWVDHGRCKLECQEGQRSTRACGLNNRSEQAVLCTEGEWTGDGECQDSDTCVDDDVNILACSDGFGRREQACVFGQWTESDCDANSLSGSTAGSVVGSLGFCGLDHEGQAICWGSNITGQLGLGHTQSASGIQRPLSTHRFQEIAIGPYHACGVTLDGDVYCWGGNESGQLGNASTLSSLTPVQVIGVSDMTGITIGDAHSCAHRANGPAYCWGDNRHGQLGIDSTVNTQSANPVLNLSEVSQLVAGGHSTCAIGPQGQLYCWGDNGDGQLGINSTTARSVPAPLSKFDNVTHVSLSQRHACAVQDRQVHCWGSNTTGELGDGSYTAQRKPVPSSLSQKARAVAVGDKMSCALLEDGGVACWGGNSSGELGRGTKSNLGTGHPVPERIGNFRENIALAVANTQAVIPVNTVCTIKKNGALFCWGGLVAGSIPPPATGNHYKPLAIPLP